MPSHSFLDELLGCATQGVGTTPEQRARSLALFRADDEHFEWARGGARTPDGTALAWTNARAAARFQLLSLLATLPAWGGDARTTSVLIETGAGLGSGAAYFRRALGYAEWRLYVGGDVPSPDPWLTCSAGMARAAMRMRTRQGARCTTTFCRASSRCASRSRTRKRACSWPRPRR